MPRRNTQHPVQVRIIGGKWRGRKLQVAHGGIRPTPDRTRVTLFNWLGAELPGARVLDLFAGTGALGFEALSRGASHATLVEHDRTAADLLVRQRARLDASAAVIERDEAMRWLRGQDDRRRWDVIFLDPPFDSPVLGAAIVAVAEHLTAQGVVYAESNAAFDLEAAAAAAGLDVSRRSRSGAVHYGLLRTRPRCRAQSI